MLKTHIDQVIFEIKVNDLNDGFYEVLYVTDWDENVTYTRSLNNKVRKRLRKQANNHYGYYSFSMGVGYGVYTDELLPEHKDLL